MQPELTMAFRSRRAVITAGAICLFLAACSKPETTADAKAAPKKAAAPATAPMSATNQMGRPGQFLSVFSTNDARDPFHPKAKKKIVGATGSTAVAAVNEQDEVVKAVQKGFDAIYTFGKDRELVLFGVPFAENVEQAVSVPIGGAVRRLKIKPIRILATRAELKVEGVPQVVVVTRQRK
jgi:hypothetical protein